MQWFYLLLLYFILLLLICEDINASNNNGDSRIDCDPQSGWECDYEPEFSHRNGDHTFCDLDILSLNDNLDEFFEKCYFKKACIINTTLDDWTNASFWKKENFIAKYGEYIFESGKSLDLVLKAGVGELKYSLNEYLKLNDKNKNNYKLKEPIYIFDHTIWETENHKFLDNYFNINRNISFYKFASSKIPYNAQILTIGNSGTGATFHSHGENWLFLVSGRKRWFLYPPNLEPVGGFWPGYSSKDWFKFIYPYLHKEYNWNNYYNVVSNYKYNKSRSNIFYRNIDGKEIVKLDKRENIFLTDYKEMNDNKIYGNSFFKPLECIQSAGQIMYLPESWWHSVINLGNVVIGGVIQTSQSRTPWKLEKDIHDQVRRGINNRNRSDLESNAKRVDGIRAFYRLKRYGPISAIYDFFIGFEYYDMNRYKQAIEHFTNALIMDPTFVYGYSYLSRIYSDKNKQNEYEYYDMDKAEEILRIGYLLNPNNPSIRRELLSLFSKTNQWKLKRLVRKRKPLPPK